MKKTDVVLRLWLSCGLFAIALAAQENSVCQTTESLPGTCIQLPHCKRLNDLHSRPRPLPPSTIRLLRAERCGVLNRQPLVCCRDDETIAEDVSTHPNVGLINPDLCGRATGDRIINGNVTGLFEMPWMALLKYRSNNGEKTYESFKCGGTLINKRYVLTAAHCISNTNYRRLISVRLGEHNTVTKRDCELSAGVRVCASQPPQNLNIEKMIKHPGFTFAVLNDDIALIRLAQPADVARDTIQPICLPVGRSAQNMNLDGQMLTVAGWGTTEHGVASSVLLKANVPVLSTDRCHAAFQQHDLNITAGQLCAGGYEQDSCHGDSGGPLKRLGVVNGEGSMIQYGVVSFGVQKCGTAGTPGVYTRVGHYMKWILDNMEP